MTGPETGRFRRVTGSVRFRITAIAALAVVVVLVVVGVGLVSLQRQVLTENLDDALVATADELEGQLASGVSADDLDGTLQADDDAYALVVDDGEVVAALGNDRPEGSGNEVTGVGSDGVALAQSVRSVEVGDEPYRVLTRPVSSEGTTTVLVVGSPLDDVDESADALVTSLSVAVPVAVAILSGVVWWLVGRTLRPVEAIRSRSAEIGGEDLHLRVPVPAGDDEVARLAETMNEMLGRIEISIERQRQFVADASHELRTPLTRMRAELEVDRDHPETADPVATEESLLEEVDAMQRLVEDLLLLARTGTTTQARVDLEALVHREVARAQGSRAGVAVDEGEVASATVVGNGDHLTRVVRNLLDNALRHASARVEVTLVADDRRAVVEVADDGPGIPPEDRERVFERFVRLDEARARDDGGTGLGLAIVAEIVERHGGSVEIADGSGPGARVRVVLPAAAPAS